MKAYSTLLLIALSFTSCQEKKVDCYVCTIEEAMTVLNELERELMKDGMSLQSAQREMKLLDSNTKNILERLLITYCPKKSLSEDKYKFLKKDKDLSLFLEEDFE